jgi:hypothetical protein
MPAAFGLFRLNSADAAEMRPEVAGRPVYLGLAGNADGLLRLNLPLARLS